MGQIRREITCLLLTVIGFNAASVTLYAQNHERFLKVHKWKITYSIKVILAQAYPEDTEGWNVRLREADTYSLIVENSTLEGSLIFDKREGRSTWIGRGKINYNIHSASRGAMGGSSFNGLMKGSGTTALCREESYFSIDPSSGTYELFLIPGDGDLSGMTVHISSDNSLWTDMANQMREKFGNISEEILTGHMDELLELNNTSEPEDAFYCTDPERWIVDLEYVDLPKQGLVINAERNGWGGGSFISWKIEPIQ